MTAPNGILAQGLLARFGANWVPETNMWDDTALPARVCHFAPSPFFGRPYPPSAQRRPCLFRGIVSTAVCGAWP